MIDVYKALQKLGVQPAQNQGWKEKLSTVLAFDPELEQACFIPIVTDIGNGLAAWRDCSISFLDALSGTELEEAKCYLLYSLCFFAEKNFNIHRHRFECDTFNNVDQFMSMYKQIPIQSKIALSSFEEANPRYGDRMMESTGTSTGQATSYHIGENTWNIIRRYERRSFGDYCFPKRLMVFGKSKSFGPEGMPDQLVDLQKKAICEQSNECLFHRNDYKTCFFEGCEEEFFEFLNGNEQDSLLIYSDPAYYLFSKLSQKGFFLKKKIKVLRTGGNYVFSHYKRVFDMYFENVIETCIIHDGSMMFSRNGYDRFAYTPHFKYSFVENIGGKLIVSDLINFTHPIIRYDPNVYVKCDSGNFGEEDVIFRKEYFQNGIDFRPVIQHIGEYIQNRSLNVIFFKIKYDAKTNALEVFVDQQSDMMDCREVSAILPDFSHVSVTRDQTNFFYVWGEKFNHFKTEIVYDEDSQRNWG